MDNDERWYIEKLTEPSASEADQINCIEVLEVLLSSDALLLFVQLLADTARPSAVRRRAAEAIHQLGADSVQDELIQLSGSGDATTRKLASVAAN